MISCSKFCVAVWLGTALALRTASLRTTPRRRTTRMGRNGRGPATLQMALDGGPKPPQRMPPAAPDATQPLETTRRTALAAAGICACGCGAYLATSNDLTFVDAAHGSRWRPEAAAADASSCPGRDAAARDDAAHGPSDRWNLRMRLRPLPRDER